MTTYVQKKEKFFCPPDSPGPQYWVIKYCLSDSSRHSIQGPRTLAVALREIKLLEIRHAPSTIEAIELSQIHPGQKVD